MSLKRRILRILTILLLLFLFIGYFSFQTFVFNPLEGDFEYDVSALIPGDVDFFSAKAKEGLVKSPVDYMIGYIRQTDLGVQLNTLDSALQLTYQRPTRPPTVNGWPSGDLWLSASGMLERANFVRDSIVTRGNAPQNDPNGNLKIEALLLPPGQRSDVEVVDRLAVVLNIKIEDAERAEYVNYLNTDRDNTGTVITDA